MNENAIPIVAVKAIRSISPGKGAPSRFPFVVSPGSSGVDGALSALADRLHPVS
jgi:hypothetical protein